MKIVAGLETEYRIAAPAKYSEEALNRIAREAVSSINENNHVKWSYKYPIELWKFDAENRMMANGSRVYNEMHSIEYSTAECFDPKDLVAVDKAGEMLIGQLLHNLRKSGYDIGIIKNNYGYREWILGHSNACHENYSVSPRLFDLLTNSKPNKFQNAWITFLVTRIILVGSGKIGPIIPFEVGRIALRETFNEFYCLSELNPLKAARRISYLYKILKGDFHKLLEDHSWWFEISQRAPFILSLRSHETMSFRPIINLRDEPHADPNSCRRLHVIIGDSNRSEFSTFLKAGMSQLILSMLEENLIPTDIAISNPIKAIKDISSDPELKTLVKTNKGLMSPLDIQFDILKNVEKFMKSSNEEKNAMIFEYWSNFLKTLAENKLKLFGYLDWVTKYVYYLNYKESNNSWQDIIWFDISYHNIGDKDLYNGLVKKGEVKCLLTEKDRAFFHSNPPSTTRAYERINIINNQKDNVKEVNWDYILFKNGQELFLKEP